MFEAKVQGLSKLAVGFDLDKKESQGINHGFYKKGGKMRIRLKASLKWVVLVVMLFSWAQVALSMGPDEALNKLKEGNARFVGQSLYSSCSCVYPGNCDSINRDRECKLTSPDDLACLKSGQHPFATIVGCSDSRIVPETIFDTGFEDLFVVRVAGNTYDDVALGSIEYGVEHAATPILVIMGHQHCGAVTATVDSLLAFSLEGATGYIRSIVLRILSPVCEALVEYGRWPTTPEEREELIALSVKKNVEYVKEVVEKKSKVVQDLIDEGKLKVVGAISYMEGAPGISPGEVIFDDDPRW